MDVLSRLDAAQTAARALRRAEHEARRRAVESMARALDEDRDAILAANQADLNAAPDLGAALRDRLRLDAGRLDAALAMMREVGSLPDPLTAVHAPVTHTSAGLRVTRRRIPLGVIAVVYEARPNVTAECAALALMSGNAIVLRGGHEAARSNAALGAALRRGLEASGLPTDAVQVWADASRDDVETLLGATGRVDLVIPRGGPRLMALVDRLARVPVIRHGEGIVQVYIDQHADPDRAVRIAYDAKVNRPGVCNAMETLLVHQRRLDLLPELGALLVGAGVELRADERSAAALAAAGVPYTAAISADWDTEFLDLKLAIRAVDDFEAALDHIARHGSHHTASIVTEDATHAERFLAEVDASCVLANASTRFNDGQQLGLGAEIGISTSKMHAYGPMGLVALTTEKFVVLGDGQTRGAPVARAVDTAGKRSGVRGVSSRE
jgi:glutamate-5-semialdehyde dehydrogenase